MSKPLRVLITEDSEEDTLLLVRELRRGGYEPIYERVDRPETMSAALSRRQWDLVISDYTMPHFRGTDALEVLKKSGLDVPFIFVSGTIGEDTAVAAMKAGAQDYIIKGNLRRFLPAVDRELREAEMRRECRRAEEQIRRQQERIRALHDINLAITSTLDLKSVLDLLLEKINLLLPDTAAATIKLFHREKKELEPAACRNIDELVWKAESWKSGRDLARVVFDSKAPMVIHNLQTNPGIKDPEFYRRAGLFSYLGVPLVAKDEVLGVLALYTKKERFYSEEEIDFISTFAGQAAVAIHNSRLYEGTKKQAIELEKANKAKGEFLSVMSHELRTPLAAVIGYTEMVRNKILGNINHQQETTLLKVIRGANELLAMMNRILEASRIETGMVEKETQEIDLDHFMGELKASASIPWDKPVSLTWDCPSRLPAIKTDGWKLRHILQNLIDNAIKFTHEGHVTVSVRYFAATKTVQFKVADTGIGIPQESLPLVFEMFRQVESSSARSHSGVGLGLYIVRTFTELLGGTIQVRSEPGKGTTFTVTVPCAT